MTFIFSKEFQKRSFRFLVGMLLLILLSLLGNFLSGFISFPLPGSVIGLALMLILLILGWIPLKWVDDAAKFLLVFMGLFYVPYGVGIINVDVAILKVGWKVILLAIITTILVLFISGKLFTYLKSKYINE